MRYGAVPNSQTGRGSMCNYDDKTVAKCDSPDLTPWAEAGECTHFIAGVNPFVTV